jgi:hypothetical protein
MMIRRGIIRKRRRGGRRIRKNEIFILFDRTECL